MMFSLIIIFHLIQVVLSKPAPEASVVQDDVESGDHGRIQDLGVIEENSVSDISLSDISLSDISLSDISLSDISLSDISISLSHEIPGQAMAIVSNENQNRTGRYDFKVSWLSSTDTDYVSNGAPNHGIVPKIMLPIKDLTISMWVRDMNGDVGPMYLSYWTQKRVPALYVRSFKDYYTFWVMGGYVNCQKGYIVLKDWHHITATWLSSGGNIAVYLDGEKLACNKDTLGSVKVIPAGYAHRMMLGLWQDASGPGTPTFTGDLAYVNMYSWFTDDLQTIRRLMEHPTERLGDILAWDQTALTMHGGVVISE